MALFTAIRTKLLLIRATVMAKIQTFFLLLTGGILNFISSVQRTIKTTLLRAMDNLIDNLSPETRIRGLSADVIRNNDTFEEKFAQLPMDLWMTIAGIPTLIIFWLAYLFPEIYNSFCKFLRSWVERIALTALIVIVALFSGYRSFRFVKERKRNSSYQNSGEDTDVHVPQISETAPYFSQCKVFRAPDSLSADQSEWIPTKWDDSSLWVTIYGFPEEAFPLIYRIYLCNSNAVNHICGSGQVNWIHIQYDDADLAEAIQKVNGTEITKGIVVMAQRPDMQHLREVKDQLSQQIAREKSKQGRNVQTKLRDYDDFAQHYRGDEPEYYIRHRYMQYQIRRGVLSDPHGEYSGQIGG